MSSRRATTIDAPTREEFSALETARSKLDGEVAAIQSTLESQGSDISALQTDVTTFVREIRQALRGNQDPSIPSLLASPPTLPARPLLFRANGTAKKPPFLAERHRSYHPTHAYKHPVGTTL
ncbi:hypothetical protein A4X13_0g8533 [Tilletia indica]|uniref:Uncharacterized protein n=1 Tax=Tilletia indica TaxID=43049 RepID=A0A177T2S4_9BASI|nr:hypothetical protein A4X13_0g8533 [Tilletia indica]